MQPRGSLTSAWRREPTGRKRFEDFLARMEKLDAPRTGPGKRASSTGRRISMSMAIRPTILKSRDKRPAFNALCRDAAQRKFDLVMAWSVDRLGRSLQCFRNRVKSAFLAVALFSCYFPAHQMAEAFREARGFLASVVSPYRETLMHAVQYGVHPNVSARKPLS